ncbi:3-phosphoshikimate 1-carboxyvinyltransferase [Paludibaculum fermentans]|uniref:3-phosphoshikimate 1-carboxyvinyltransferase n=1 Tax=Paludibaculum fermentans TaxID=1473598 RepID=A0A7S7SHX8_PALFE|nr:3-phosphoshikimate 1-carboxyvinyltransferase [Paludibaculum fermentans]QOY85464.1 3-phosphoshikimate 1-carboxyvinyltransferase [Paludibaculum fermentans]
MREIITPGGALEGTVRLPGDKSISHRYGMLAAVAEGVSTIHNYSSGADCHSTLGCVRSLGIEVEIDGRQVKVHGRGIHGWQAPATDLDAGNSGSTIRMISGLLAGQPFTSRLIGDESLSQRPMQRIMGPLTQMGATLTARDGKFPPLEIQGADLQPIDYTLPVASAQVKSCVLLAGLTANGETTVHESATTRDHTEVALREFGVDIETGRGWARVKGPARLEARELTVPGDISSAAFFLVAGAIVPGSKLVLQDVGLNPTRATLIEFLVSTGVDVKILDMRMSNGEPRGDLLVQGSQLKGGLIEKQWAAALIDEIPVLAILGAVSSEGLTVRDASELRIKESDRIETVATNLRKMGVTIETTPDGFYIPGGQTFHSAEVESYHDHRIAMAFAVASLRADGPVAINGSEAASVSFPEFWSTLRGIIS